jgi:hypothetical protein
MEVHGPQLAKADVDETFANDVKVAGGESVIDIVSSTEMRRKKRSRHV